jgi:hypothetical protein
VPRCTATKHDGTPCQSIVKGSQQVCHAHDPARAEQRRRAASIAGKSRGPSGELAEVKGHIKSLVTDLLEAKVDKGVASVAFQGFGVLCRYLELEYKIKEQEELEQRLEELESTLEAQARQKDRGYGYTG